MSDKGKIICHGCRWGAAPGHLTRCNLPGLTPHMAFGIVSKAVAEDSCGHYEPDTLTAPTEEVKHFNKWMAAHNRPDLMIKK